MSPTSALPQTPPSMTGSGSRLLCSTMWSASGKEGLGRPAGCRGKVQQSLKPPDSFLRRKPGHLLLLMKEAAWIERGVWGVGGVKLRGWATLKINTTSSMPCHPSFPTSSPSNAYPLFPPPPVRLAHMDEHSHECTQARTPEDCGNFSSSLSQAGTHFPDAKEVGPGLP